MNHVWSYSLHQASRPWHRLRTAPLSCDRLGCQFLARVVFAFSTGTKEIQDTETFTLLLEFCTESCRARAYQNSKGAVSLCLEKWRGGQLSGSAHWLKLSLLCKDSSLVSWLRMAREIRWILRFEGGPRAGYRSFEIEWGECLKLHSLFYWWVHMWLLFGAVNFEQMWF